MRTFAELLSEYMARTGISDSELGRTLGVRRQTIFRWKEGLVEKPRYREDVLRCAERLRLSPAERDGLLLAAGFPPESPETIPGAALTAPNPKPALIETALTPAAPLEPSPPLPTLFTPRLRWLAIAAVVLVIALGGVGYILTQQSAKTYPQAMTGESLIVVGKLGEATRQTIDGRAVGASADEWLRSALEREITAGRLANMRVVIWPEQIQDQNAAQSALRRANATLVVAAKREGDSVTVTILAQSISRPADLPLDALVVAPTSFSLKVIPSSPEDLRTLTLLALAQVYIDRGELDAARATLVQTVDRTSSNPQSLAAVELLLGYVCQMAQPPDFNAASQAYSQVLAVNADSVARLNRGLAYLRQGKSAEWHEDLRQALIAKPDDSTVRLALCWGYALENAPQEARPHCDVLGTGNPRTREVRAIVFAEAGQLSEAATELRAFLTWLDQQPESLRVRYGSSRSEWLTVLTAGRNPFDQSVLDSIRRE